MEFSVGEFKGSMTPDILIQAIKKGCQIDIPAEETSIKELNKLLESKDLYTFMDNKPDGLNDLISRLEQGTELSKLELKRFNRLLIETNYPLETPKSQILSLIFTALVLICFWSSMAGSIIQRDEFMRNIGLRVLRFSDREVFENIEGIIEKIWENL